MDKYANPAVAVDVVLLTVLDGGLRVLLLRRDDAWALPGAFVRIDEPLEATVERVLAEKARLPGAFLEQLFTFGAPDRDPRGRVISVAYYALVPAEALIAAIEGADELMLAQATEPPALAFDHAHILEVAVARLRGKLDYSPVGMELLPELFTLRELQEVHEAILSVRFAKPAFRRRMLDKGWLAPTGLLETGVAYRPAELYRRIQPLGGHHHG